jgi:hypothetical protein
VKKPASQSTKKRTVITSGLKPARMPFIEVLL